MEATATPTEEEYLKALHDVMSRITDRRTMIEYTMVEKIQRTYRIKANSWKAAKEMIPDAEHAGTYGGWAFDVESDCIYELDGSYEYISEQKPRFVQKLAMVRIGNHWICSAELVDDPIYWLKKVTRWD